MADQKILRVRFQFNLGSGPAMASQVLFASRCNLFFRRNESGVRGERLRSLVERAGLVRQPRFTEEKPQFFCRQNVTGL